MAAQRNVIAHLIDAGLLGAPVEEINLAFSGSELLPLAPTSSVRALRGELSLQAGSTTLGNNSGVGVRGAVTIPAGATLATGFVYGTQGKLIVAGTLNNGSGFNSGLFGQLDLSAIVAHTSGYMAPLILDLSTTSALATDPLADMAVLLNTSQCLINSIVKTEAKANFFVDLNDLGQGAYLDAGTGASASVNGHIKVKINGVTAYLRTYASAS